MSESPTAELGRRERQIMEIIYRRGQATVGEVQGDLPGSPNYSTVRAMLKYLENKGFLRHVQEGARYVYLPTADRSSVRLSALEHVVRTFFNGSVSTAVATLLETKGIGRAERARLNALLANAAKRTDPK